jgi:oligoribonuclease NrnB/cAMP/cGMP phosphodiesterase (DHH superfamily)
MDSDGHASCAVVYNNLLEQEVPEDQIAVHPVNYGIPLPEEIDYEKDHIYMVDYSLQPLDIMTEFAEKLGERFIWIDHHSTSVDMEKESALLAQVKGMRQTEWDEGSPISGCELTWKYFYHNEVIPRPLILVGDWDTWRWNTDKRKTADPDQVKAFQYFLRIINSSPKNPEGRKWWRGALARHDSMTAEISQGKVLLEYQRRQWRSAVGANGFMANFRGLRAVMVNAKGNSEMFNDFFDPERHDIMVTFILVQGEYLTVSMYTTKTNVIHLGKFAKEVGEAGDIPSGGGHAGAAGFQCSWEYFKTLYEVTGNFTPKK